MKGADGSMPAIGIASLSKWAQTWLSGGDPSFNVGDAVRVRLKLSPLAGRSGKILEINPDDSYGPYLVRFDNGLRFRYHGYELALTNVADSAHRSR